MMKTLRTFLLELLLVILLVPQAFVLFYYFTFFFKGGNPSGLLKSLAVYALTISWVSAPFLAVVALLVKVLLERQVRWLAVLVFCLGAGGLWVTAWNRLVFDIFAYRRAAVPVLLCSLGMAGYAWAHNFYRRSLPPETIKNGAGDLSE